MPPATPGSPLTSVDSPAALLDLAAAEDNIAHACALVRAASARGGHPSPSSIRPHFKAHTCTQLAALLIRLSGGHTPRACARKRRRRRRPACTQASSTRS